MKPGANWPSKARPPSTHPGSGEKRGEKRALAQAVAKPPEFSPRLGALHPNKKKWL